MDQLTPRVGPLLVGIVTLAATALPAAADPEENAAWGQQAVEWCRDGNAAQFENFGQCVSHRVHELKGDSTDEKNEADSEDEQDTDRAEVGEQGGQGHGHAKNKTTDEQDSDLDAEQDDEADHGHAAKAKVGQQGGQGQGARKNKNK
jgi:hypothetical protein